MLPDLEALARRWRLRMDGHRVIVPCGYLIDAGDRVLTLVYQGDGPLRSLRRLGLTLWSGREGMTLELPSHRLGEVLTALEGREQAKVA